MDTFSPEFAAYWQDEPQRPSERSHVERAPSRQVPPSPSQEAALEELAERVSAARSIV